jgi:phosphatidylserine decarboxylase
MIDLIDNVVRNPPIFRDYFGGAPGLSFNNILGSVIVTRSGFNAFCNDELNKALQEILSEWCEYLSGSSSAEGSLTCDKWLSIESIANLSTYLHDFIRSQPSDLAFKHAYVINDSLPHWGFQSWNDFFSRPFVSAEIFDYYRPMLEPKLPSDDVITSAADSRVYGIATNVSETDTFWLKGHRYSLKHLFNNFSLKDGDEPFHKKFIGGTVYQAYLLPSDYHQWTMPISGTVKKIVTIPGTYFALSHALVDPAEPDEFASLVEGLPYLTIVSARKIAIIEADNPKLGTVCFIPVGLQEISSVKFFHNLEKEEKHLNKGDALGTFQFGGSTVCMVFEPKVNIKWEVSQLEHVLIRSKIAEVY